jgi:hypothetical protein
MRPRVARLTVAITSGSRQRADILAVDLLDVPCHDLSTSSAVAGGIPGPHGRPHPSSLCSSALTSARSAMS